MRRWGCWGYGICVVGVSEVLGTRGYTKLRGYCVRSAIRITLVPVWITFMPFGVNGDGVSG